MCLTLKDDKGGLVSVLVDDSLNMRDLDVGPVDRIPVTDHISRFRVGLIAPVTKPGTYDVYVSVGKQNGTPAIALPLRDNDGQRRYKIGKITIQ